MYKKFILIIILITFFLLIFAGEKYNTYIPDINEIPLNYELFPIKYSYLEFGFNTNNSFSLYYDYLKNKEFFKISILFFTSNKNFSTMNFHSNIYANKNLKISINNDFAKYEDTLNIISNFSKINILYSHNNYSFSYSPILHFINNDNFVYYFRNFLKFSFSNNILNYSVLSKWQSRDLLNSHISFLFNNNSDFSIGLIYSNSFLPYVRYEKKYSNSIFVTELDVDKYYPLLPYSIYFDKYNNIDYYSDRTIYHLNANYNSFYINFYGEIYVYVDSMNIYSDSFSDSLNIFFKMELKKHFNNFYASISSNYYKDMLYNGAMLNIFFNYSFKDMIININSNYYFNNEIIVSPFISLGNKKNQVLCGIKNLFNHTDKLFIQYANSRTFFINFVNTDF